MIEIALRNLKNEVIRKESVDAEIFSSEFRPGLLNEYVVMQRRRLRAGTHSTKTRAEVSGTGKKPFKQKGTGHARQGTLIGPHQPGGGIAFGPKPRSYSTKLTTKTKREALKVALSQKRYEEKLFLLDSFQVGSGKTKDAMNTLSVFGSKSYLIVGEFDVKTIRSLRNVGTVKLLSPNGLNVFDILKHEQLVITKDALSQVVAKLRKS